MTVATNIVWFRNDLRLEDNDALAAALSSGGPVIPVYVFQEDPAATWPLSERRREWLAASLCSLDEQLQARGSRLVLRSGEPIAALTTLMVESGAQAVYFNRRFDPGGIAEDDRVEQALREQGVRVYRTRANLLFEPEEILNNSGEPYRVFTPYWKRLLTEPDPGRVTRAPERIASPALLPQGLELSIVGRADGTFDISRPGEGSAHRRLREFANATVDRYSQDRDLPGVDATSRLSVHLAFGEISVRRLWSELSSPYAERQAVAMPFLRQLAWREFAYYLLHHFPASVDSPWRTEFMNWPWRDDPDAYLRWQRGETGYPFVDACMRQLLETGWMHNRGRLVTASFLTKHLLISWLDGARWFWANLLDADIANNTMGWQWTAGTGADAAPYFRVFNPVVQGERFDAGGDFVRRWVPEVSALPNRFVHKPWLAPQSALHDAGVVLGETYPEPMVDLRFARQRALDTYSRFNREKVK